MNCREAEKRIYIYTELTPREREETDIHIHGCGACKEVSERVTLARSIAMSSSPPPLADPADVTRRIMNAVHTRQRWSFSFHRFSFPRAYNMFRYAMAAASLILVAGFFAEYNGGPQAISTKAMYTTNIEDIRLNTTSFSRALVATKGERDGGTELYECVVDCLRRGDETCALCSIGFSKPK